MPSKVEGGFGGNAGPVLLLIDRLNLVLLKSKVIRMICCLKGVSSSCLCIDEVEHRNHIVCLRRYFVRPDFARWSVGQSNQRDIYS